MSVRFDLYDELSRKDNDILIESNVMCRTITNLDKEHTEMVYALILHHHILTTGQIPTSPPCNANIVHGGNCIKALWINLSPELQKIIANYINMNKSL